MGGPETQEKEKCGGPGEKRREAEGKKSVPSLEAGRGKVCAGGFQWCLVPDKSHCQVSHTTPAQGDLAEKERKH